MRGPTSRIDDSDDVTLVKAMLAGSREAFATLFQRHRVSVYRFARQMSGSAEVADDVTQDVFVSFMETAERFAPELGSLKTYLYGIARNLILRRLRYKAVHAEVVIDDVEQLPHVMIQADPLSQIERARALARLRRAILALPAVYREVIVLCELHELSYEEAARVAECPIGTIRSRLNRARRVLAQKCGDLAETDDARRIVARRCLA
jgi:RNA polymerase sigma-70 factor (ECF subfamily)